MAMTKLIWVSYSICEMGRLGSPCIIYMPRSRQLFCKQTTDIINSLCGSHMPADIFCLFVCVEVLRPSQPNGVMSSAVSLHTFTGQA